MDALTAQMDRPAAIANEQTNAWIRKRAAMNPELYDLHRTQKPKASAAAAAGCSDGHPKRICFLFVELSGCQLLVPTLFADLSLGPRIVTARHRI